jgi:hypothetical protein
MTINEVRKDLNRANRGLSGVDSCLFLLALTVLWLFGGDP